MCAYMRLLKYHNSYSQLCKTHMPWAQWKGWNQFPQGKMDVTLLWPKRRPPSPLHVSNYFATPSCCLHTSTNSCFTPTMLDSTFQWSTFVSWNKSSPSIALVNFSISKVWEVSNSFSTTSFWWKNNYSTFGSLPFPST